MERVLNMAKDIDKTFRRKGRKGLESGKGYGILEEKKKFW